MKKLLAGLALAALALAPVSPVAAQVSLNLNQPQPTVDTTGAAIDPATKQGQGLPTDAPCATYDTTACGQIGIQKQVSKSTATVAATVAPAGTLAGTGQTVTTVLPQLAPTAGLAISYGTTAANLFAANAARHFMTIQVQGTTGGCYINGIAGATADANSLYIPAGGYFESSTHVGTGAISIVCTAASTPVYSRQG